MTNEKFWRKCFLALLSSCAPASDAAVVVDCAYHADEALKRYRARFPLTLADGPAVFAGGQVFTDPKGATVTIVRVEAGQVFYQSSLDTVPMNVHQAGGAALVADLARNGYVPS